MLLRNTCHIADVTNWALEVLLSIIHLHIHAPYDGMQLVLLKDVSARAEVIIVVLL